MSRYPAHLALRNAFDDLVLDNSETGIVPFFRHIGVRTPDRADMWWPAFMEHYRQRRKIDIDRFCRDLATFPPIVARVAEIRAELKSGPHA